MECKEFIPVEKSIVGVQASMAVMTNNHWNEPDLDQTEMSVPELYEALGGADGVAEFFMKHPLKKCNTNLKTIYRNKFSQNR